MYSPLVCKVLKVSLLILLLAIFRLGYEFVYRDGRRAAMRADMGSAFPQLAGIRSDTATLNLYLDLKALAMRYPHFKTLPAFPQANFLTKTRPPLPLDWVVNREMGGAEAQVQAALERARPVLFIEKNYAAQIDTNPELAFTRECLQRGILLMETPHFWVVQY